MVEPPDNIAICTIVYPGVEPYLGDWFASLRQQTDQNHHLYIGLDAIGAEDAIKAMGGDPKPTWIVATPGSTLADVRQIVYTQIASRCDAVIFVDSDDRLHPTRVAAARAALQHSDLSGCALQLIDAHGRDYGRIFGVTPGISPEEVLPRHNIFGLSNTAYRSSLLQKCLPIPSEAVLVDWLLATRAWLLGARLAFDPVPRMDYRQHGANLARVIPPFTAEQVMVDTGRMRRHFDLLRRYPLENALDHRLTEVHRVAEDIEVFETSVVHQPERLARYVRALNQLPHEPVWGFCVAHPALNAMWQ